METKFSPILAYSNEIVFFGKDWTAKEFNLFLIMWSIAANNKFEHTKEYCIRISDIEALTQVRWPHKYFIKKKEEQTIIEKLSQKGITICKSPDDYTVYLIFQQKLRYNKGLIKFAFSPEFINLITNTKSGNFSIVKLSDILQLETLPSKILFMELIKDEWRLKILKSFTIKDYIKLIGKEEKKLNPADLITKNVVRPLDEINRKNLFRYPIKYKTLKDGNAFSKVIFIRDPSIEEIWNHFMREVLKIKNDKIRQSILQLSLDKIENNTIILWAKNKDHMIHIENDCLDELSIAIKKSTTRNFKLIYRV